MTDEKHDRFDRALREWARRRPQTPATEARRRVLQRIERPPEPRALRPPWQFALAGLALLVALGAGWIGLQPTPPAPPATELEAPLLDEDVVLLWLDPETPLYLIVATPMVKGGS